MGTISLAEDFREFLRLLNSTGVEYLLVGGYAMAVHGHPRSTGDLDLWIAIDASNAERTAEAVRRFGFDMPAVNADLFRQPGKVVRMGVPPLRIGIITTATGVDFPTCFGRGLRCDLDGVPVRVIGREDLLANKRAAGRAKDLADVEALSPPKPA